MEKRILLGLLLLFALSCNKEDDIDIFKNGNGTVWISGGLADCAEQIRLDNGNILIVEVDEINSFKSGDRVIVKYKETGTSILCSPSIECEIIKIEKL